MRAFDAHRRVDAFDNIPLRRALFRGYRVSDVHVLAAHWRAGMDRLQADVTQATARATELEVELRVIRTRLEEYVRREMEVKAALADIDARARDIEESAKARARQVVREAEEHAALLRSEALERLTTVGRQFEDLLKARDSFVSSVRAALDQVEPVLRELDTTAPAPVREEELRAPPPVEEAGVQPEPTQAVVPVQPEDVVPEPPEGDTELSEDLHRRVSGIDDRERVYEGRVELDAGPFADFAELSSFAREVRRIPGLVDVAVGAFADDRAVLALTLDREVVLARALADAATSDFEIDAADDRSLSITFATEAPSGTP